MLTSSVAAGPLLHVMRSGEISTEMRASPNDYNRDIGHFNS